MQPITSYTDVETSAVLCQRNFNFGNAELLIENKSLGVSRNKYDVLYGLLCIRLWMTSAPWCIANRKFMHDANQTAVWFGLIAIVAEDRNITAIVYLDLASTRLDVRYFLYVYFLVPYQ